MSLPAQPWNVMPEATSPVARAAVPKGNPSMRRRDALGPISTTPTWAALFAPTGRPAAALALELSAPGCDASVRSAFRQRLITGHAALLLCETRLTRFGEQGARNAQGRQRPDSTPVLAALPTRNRLEGVGETRRHALNGLATPSEFAVLPTMQAPLATRQLPPGEQWVDGGSVTSDHLLPSQPEYGRDLRGPVRADQSGQEQAATGFRGSPMRDRLGRHRRDLPARARQQTATCKKGYARRDARART